MSQILSVEDAFNIIKSATEKLVTTKSPTLRNRSTFSRVNQLLKNGTIERAHRIYINFLLDVERECGLSMRICASFLGQRRVAFRLSKDKRKELLTLLTLHKHSQPFNTPIDSYFVKQGTKQRGLESNDPYETAYMTGPSPESIADVGYHIVTTQGGPAKFDHASLEGIQMVFNDKIYNVIRKIRIGGEVSERASMSMSIPNHIETEENVPCLMTLDIHRNKANSIILGLFSVQIINTDALRPDSTYVTLKGANVNKIEEIFGHQIHHAINQCPLRKDEITFKEMGITNCISISLEDSTAWVNLSLGLSRAIDLIHKLQFRTVTVCTTNP
ncbi:hypothetical protein GGI42DRAFT_218921 [Trichoderma sp. SZMC 28013]